MITDAIIANSPALLVMIPLIAAFACPFIGRISPAVRNIWVVGAMVLTAAMALLLAGEVLSGGTVVYTFGASAAGMSIPPDSGGIPVRIVFTVDAMSALMQIIGGVTGLAVILYSIASDRRHTGLESYYTLYLLMIAGVAILVTLKKGSTDNGKGRPGQLTGRQIEKILVSPLERSPNKVTADRRLRQARQLFLNRHAEKRNLYLCVLNYRLYKAYRRKAERVFEPQDERNFRIVKSELANKIQSLYDSAWAYENGRRWEFAFLELEQILRYIPVEEAAGDLRVEEDLIDNVLAHSRYVSERLSKQKKR